MKIILLIGILFILLGGSYFFVFKYYEANEQKFTSSRKLKFFGISIGILIFLLPKLMGLFGIYTARIFVYGSERYNSENYSVAINGKEVVIPKRERYAEIIVSNFFPKITYKKGKQTKSERLNYGTYIFNASQSEEMSIEEKRYKSISGDYNSMDKPKFEGTLLSGQLLNIDEEINRCEILPPNFKMPKYVKAKYKGKRMFVVRLNQTFDFKIIAPDEKIIIGKPFPIKIKAIGYSEHNIRLTTGGCGGLQVYRTGEYKYDLYATQPCEEDQFGVLTVNTSYSQKKQKKFQVVAEAE